MITLKLTTKQAKVLEDIVKSISPNEKVKAKSGSEQPAAHKIDCLVFSPVARVHGRLMSQLKKAGITTIKALARKTEKELLKVKGVSVGGVKQIKDALAKHGLTIK